MATPQYSISCVANLFCKQMLFTKAGDVEHGHCHAFDHTTLLGTGSVEVKANGKTSRFTAPQMIFIKADVEHEITALEDGTVAYCIHALRDGDGVGDILDPASVPAGVNPLRVAKELVAD
jgi:quercetin dioxygenase-like cupin family protein